MTTRDIISELTSSFRSEIDHHGGKECHICHVDPGPTLWEGCNYKDAISDESMVDFSSENCPVHVSMTVCDHRASFRTQIDFIGL